MIFHIEVALLTSIPVDCNRITMLDSGKIDTFAYAV